MAPPLPLRAHQVLCLQGFRGKGYSPAFIEAMGNVHRALAQDPEQPIALTTGPDRLCEACPHLAATGCTLGGPTHEAHMRAHDTEVLRRLGFEAGGVYAWREVLERIGQTVRGGDLPAICTTCPWLPLGMCAESIDDLRGSASIG